jgi:hypothetical protein
VKDFSNFLGLGIAGNFALHLDQAGEAEDFKDIITEDEAAPKGMFPFYLPCKIESSSKRPRPILSTYPLSSQKIQLPNEQVNVQAEPEVGLVCEIEYKDGLIAKITPTHFGAYNDCSIREAGREKISDKKNWGKDSKGIAQTLLSIDKFSQGGIMDKYTICSFLRRDSKLHAYGEDVELSGYSYFYEKLTEWITNQINTQEDFGPLEDIKAYIKACDYPTKALISIGATRYTPYGESTFLQRGDEVIVALYNRERYTLKDIQALLENEEYSDKELSILAQEVL